VQKISPKKRAIKTSKIGSGPWFEHPGTFHIYIWSKYTKNTWIICHTGGVMERRTKNRQILAKNTPNGKIFELVMHPYHVYWLQMQELGIYLTHRWTRFYHIFGQLYIYFGCHGANPSTHKTQKISKACVHMHFRA